MFGKNTGVSVQTAAEQPKALSTHYQGHSLNLKIKTTMSKSMGRCNGSHNRDHFVGIVLT